MDWLDQIGHAGYIRWEDQWSRPSWLNRSSRTCSSDALGWMGRSSGYFSQIVQIDGAKQISRLGKLVEAVKPVVDKASQVEWVGWIGWAGQACWVCELI